MKLQLADTRLLKESVNLISELVNEVCFKVDTEKVSLLATDPANVAMIDFKLLHGAFTEFLVEKPVELSVSLDNLKAILKRAKPEDCLTLTLDDSRNRLTVELIGTNRRTFNLALIDRDNEEQKLPNLNFTASVSLPATRFDDAIADMGVVSDSVALLAEVEKFTIKAEGTVSDAKVELPVTEYSTIDLSDQESVMAKYSLSYLSKMASGSKLADNVLISFASDYPLRIKYSVPNKLELGFILAPRVSND
ncbi:MAG: proliferating cell nuclear antigen (pcna) [Nanoarchaeota archaeon]|nr:proliferating cell nuclear antigen (pcna) [Nanoarchaeota archaeon]MBU4241987.1 proliferating cell nuclear antigen (pcna) [Nanoarchaeota archaeon]MBU4352375.1 proliferating cell nuclear antigen (pcna) [Nanoarchaeota archaeon]MBU4456756.1 proliferating cell nuclear antigen (pcna) [Nanoarchaeota archaeon]MCG2719408.1 proliferating cell nuclear antigen (pcna) [Nanoarchaeota archaeon]